MRILIEERVHQAIESFYDAAILRHWHTLSFDTVENKKNRLYDGLESLANYATIFPKARLKKNGLIRDGRNLSARISILRMRLRLTLMEKK